MSPIGTHLAADPELSIVEQAYLRVFGSPEPALRVRTAHVVREVAKYAPATVVDIGAGAGFVAITLALRLPRARVVAVEPGKSQLESGRSIAARAGVPNLTFVQSNVSEHTEYNVDAVVCVDTLEYVDDDIAGLRMMSSWLRPGGVLVLHCRRLPTPYRLRRFKTADALRDGRVRAGYEPDQIRTLLAAARLVPRQFRTTLTLPAELAYELVDPDLGILNGRLGRAVVAPLLNLVAQFDRLSLGAGAGMLVTAERL